MSRPAAGTLALHGGTPVREQFLPLTLPMIGEREKALVLETLNSGWITTGPRAHALGRGVAERVGARHGLAVNSATAALHLALAALEVGPGDAVIAPTWTFAACINVIEHVGATPVIVDVEPDTLCIDPAAVRRAIAPNTRVIMPVDYAGHPCDHDAIGAIARAAGARVVADAAHALGASWQGRAVGTLADVTAFSFYATKNLTTGEGGAAVTDDDTLADRMALLSLHGMSRDAWKRYGDSGSWYYEVVAPGFKYNLSDVLAAIGVAQLERFDAMQQLRAGHVARYDRLLADVPEIRRPTTRPGAVHAWHLYPVALELERLTCDRAQFIAALRAENIGSSVHFIPIHRHPHFRDALKLDPAGFPVAERAWPRAVSLPLYPHMTARDVEDAAVAVRKVVAHFRR